MFSALSFEEAIRSAIKNHLLNLVGILFPHINDDARSKSQQYYLLKSPVFDTWQLNKFARILEHQPRIAFVYALGSQLCEVAFLRAYAIFVQMVLIIRGNRYGVLG